MDVCSKELVWKKMQKDNAHREPNLRLPSFSFTNQELQRKRYLWRRLFLLTGVRGSEKERTEILIELVKRFSRRYDRPFDELLRELQYLWPDAGAENQAELGYAFDSFADTLRKDKSRFARIHLVLLKLSLSSGLRSHASAREGAEFARVLRQKLSFPSAETNYLNYKFYPWVAKVSPETVFPKPAVPLEDDAVMRKHPKFNRLMLKKLTREKKNHEALFLIQTILADPKHSTETYYAANKALKLCGTARLEIPDAFWHYFESLPLPALELLDKLVTMFLKKKVIFLEERQALVERGTLRVLLTQLGTKNLWVFFSKHLAHRLDTFGINIPRFVLFHAKLIADAATKGDFSQLQTQIKPALKSLFELVEHIQLDPENPGVSILAEVKAAVDNSKPVSRRNSTLI